MICSRRNPFVAQSRDRRGYRWSRPRFGPVAVGSTARRTHSFRRPGGRWQRQCHRRRVEVELHRLSNLRPTLPLRSLVFHDLVGRRRINMGSAARSDEHQKVNEPQHQRSVDSENPDAAKGGRSRTILVGLVNRSASHVTRIRDLRKFASGVNTDP